MQEMTPILSQNAFTDMRRSEIPEIRYRVHGMGSHAGLNSLWFTYIRG